MVRKINIPLPVFLQFGEQYYKIANEEKILTVCNYDFDKKIEYLDLEQCDPFYNWGWHFITEERFNEIFIKVFSELEEFLPKTIIEDL